MLEIPIPKIKPEDKINAKLLVHAIGINGAKLILSGNTNSSCFGCTVSDAKYWLTGSNEYHINPFFFPNMSNQRAVEMDELRFIVDGYDLVIALGGIEKVKIILSSIPEPMKFYYDLGYLMFHVKHGFYMEFSNTIHRAEIGKDFSIEMLGKSIYKLKDGCVYIQHIEHVLKEVESLFL